MLSHPHGVIRHCRWDHQNSPTLLPTLWAGPLLLPPVSSVDAVLPLVCTEHWVPGHKLAEKLPVYG